MKKQKTSKKKTTKAAKPAAGGTKLASIQKHLLEMREDLLRSVKRPGEIDTADTGDPVDQAQSSIEKELFFDLSANERIILDQIEASLRKIEKGHYGLCESCKKAIPAPRLKALPFARYCIACQSASESSIPEPAGDVGPDFRAIEESGRDSNN
jgi:DnaK suppressor protein